MQFNLKAKMIAKVHAEYPETEAQACLLQTCCRTHNGQLRTFFGREILRFEYVHSTKCRGFDKCRPSSSTCCYWKGSEQNCKWVECPRAQTGSCIGVPGTTSRWNPSSSKNDGAQQFGARVVYEDSLFLLIFPSEHHSNEWCSFIFEVMTFRWLGKKYIVWFYRKFGFLFVWQVNASISFVFCMML